MSWKPEDYIVAGLAVLIIAGMFVRVYGVVFLDRALGVDAARMAENMLTGIISIISMYIGAKIQKHRDKDD